MPPYQGGGEMIGTVSFEKTTFADLPFKFEAGTPDFVGIAAFSRAIDYILGLGLENISAHEHRLLQAATEGLMQIPGMRIFGTAADKDAVLSFLVGNVSSYDIGLLLDKLGVAVRTGHHCAALDASSWHRRHGASLVCGVQYDGRSRAVCSSHSPRGKDVWI